MIKYLLLAILGFGVLIAVHELGHFLAAKACGVRVNEFSVGMGPLLWQKKKGETDYSLRALPIGGYCAMEGEDEESDDPRSLGHQGFWKQLLIFAAGAAMNFLAGLVILFFLYAGANAFYTAEIVELNPAFPQQGESGLMPGDEIYRINGERIYLYSDVATVLELKSRGDTMEMVVLRNGEKLTRTLTKQTYTDDSGSEYSAYGFSYRGVVQSTPLLKLKYTWYNAIDYVRLVRLSLQMLLSGEAGADDLGGPVQIVSTITRLGTETEAEKGVSAALESVFNLIALIAVNLAVMNLLPIPALDGGKILFLVVDTIALKLLGKKIPSRFENWVNVAGLVLLMGLMLFVTVNDIRRFF